jgi:DNA modification methylase
MSYMIRLVTPPGGTVLDPFAGTATVGKVCARLGRSFIGTELKLSVALVLIIVVLTIKPAGLFGKVIVSRV